MKRYLIGFAFVSSILGMASAAFGQISPAVNTAATIEGQKTDEKVPYYGLTFDFTAGDSSNLNSIGENYRNDLVFYFEPSWNVGSRFLKNTWAKSLQIAARFSLTQEVAGTDDSSFGATANSGPHGTCSNITPSTQGGVVDPTQVGYCHPAGNDRRTDYSDVWLTFRMPKVYSIPKIGVAITPSVRFVLPSSLESQYNNLALSITPSLSLSRAFWKDRIRLGYGLGFTGNIHTARTASIDPQSPTSITGAPTAGTANPYNTLPSLSNFYNDPSRVSTAYNVDYGVNNTFSGSVQFNDKWSFDLLYILINSFYNARDCSYTVNGQTFDLCASGDAVAAASGSNLSRGIKGGNQVFWATLNYQVLDYLGLSLAWITLAPTYNPDSSYRQGIISTDYNGFTQVQLSATLTIDKLANKLVAKYRKN